MGKKHYHAIRKNKADLQGLLRCLVCAYLLFLAWKLATYSGNDPTFPPVLGPVAGGVLAVAAIAFGVFAVKRYLTDLRGAQLTDEEEEALERDADDEDDL